jgi:hypothetical protein
MSHRISSIPRIGPFTTMMFGHVGYQTLEQLKNFNVVRDSDHYRRFMEDMQTLKAENPGYTPKFWKRAMTRCMNIINAVQSAEALPVAPEYFLCFISGSIMEDPVVLPNGTSCERSEIEEWIEQKGTCPFTRKPLSVEQLISNRHLRDAIDDYHRNYAPYVISFKNFEMK